MPESITVTFKDTRKPTLVFQRTIGGRQYPEIRYEPGWCICTDEWGSETAIPSAEIDRVETREFRTW